ncbi:MAG: hypothetical protein HOW73_47695 [Polyangiaceae bacterium]|nr:hypothetical protein [Polyangiaceae bacterium]
MRRHISRESGRLLGTGVCVIDCDGGVLRETRSAHEFDGGSYRVDILQEIRSEDREVVVR